MADDGPQPPTISISRTWTTGSKTDKNAPVNQENKASSQPPAYESSKPHPWKHGLQTIPYGGKYSKHDPLQWKRKWTKECFASGRVLIIDYITTHANDVSGDTGKHHVAVAAQEIESLKALESFYSSSLHADPRHAQAPALRVIHVQNCPWATGFLLAKFNIDHDSEMIGMSGFTKWARYNGPRQRNGKPFPNGRSWREQTDPWRNISRTAFGLDYLKTFESPDPRAPRRSVFGDRPLDAHMMHLNTYPDGRSPHGYDVSVQRLNVYVQRNLGPASPISPEDQKKNPYAKHQANGTWGKGDEDKISIESLDNSSTLIIFETSASMLLGDCLIQPRNELESRWRRLPFYLRKQDIRGDDRLASQCTNVILGDVFHALAIIWQEFLAAGQDHVNLLEDKIYDNPADESRAPELWDNQAAWLKVNKVMYIHQDLVREMQGHLRDVANVDSDDSEPQSGSQTQIEWLSSIPTEYERLAHGVDEDLLQPTANLNDLMYKSVGIRDSRQSLQLGLSMWRLSWITFIFLPLTFIVSFFGMNVNIFGGETASYYPNVGWYFLAAFILMIFVLLLWYCVKHSLEQRRQTPYQRGLYEQLFTKLEDKYPLLWTSGGAVDDVQPVGFVNKMKWKLLRRWFAPDKTIDKRTYSSLIPDEDDHMDFGVWARIKRYYLKRWLPGIQLKRRAGADEEIAMGDVVEQNVSTSAPASLRNGSAGAITELAKATTSVAMAEAQPMSMQQITTMRLEPFTSSDERRRRRSSSPKGAGRAHSEERPSSRDSSGIMFEERNLSDSESDAGEGARASPRRSRETRSSE